MTHASVVGIDLGTTFSLAAYVENGQPVAVRDGQGVALIPSAISFHDDGTVLVGTAARDRALSDPEHTIFSVKRLMGRTLADLERDREFIPHQIVEREMEGGRKVLRVNIAGHEHTPEELSAMILREVRKRAGNPTKAVITVPAYFDDSQRQATRDAGRIAGLDVLRIVNEPTAAALAYGLDRKKNGIVVVYDLGGGTFDCSVLKLADGVFQVLSTNGDTHLGGDDFDRTLMEFAAAKWNLNEKSATILQQLRDAAEKAKIALSSADRTELILASGGRKPPDAESVAIGDASGGLRPPLAVTRSEFESFIAPLVDRSLAKCRAAIKDAGITVKQVDEVVMVGGSTRVPLVRRRVEELFGKPPHTELNPDEVVALGAAVQADILAGNRRDVLLLDVVPLSLGIETLGGVVDKVIHRNSTVPCRAATRYTTFADNQTAILLNIYQGERELVKDCRLLGTFKLGGIPPMPAQFAQVDVTFLVDQNGLLTVSAKELRSGAQAQVTVQPAHGLSGDEVEQLVNESIAHAADDFARRRFIELKNKGEADLRHTEKALAQAGHALNAEQRTAIDSAAASLRSAMAGSDVNVLQAAINAFANATNPLATILMNEVVKRSLAGTTEQSLRGDAP